MASGNRKGGFEWDADPSRAVIEKSAEPAWGWNLAKVADAASRTGLGEPIVFPGRPGAAWRRQPESGLGRDQPSAGPAANSSEKAAVG